eukprot:TRINITY_DN30246_c0_g1_i1.p2 TRINITY_DN30246_c0_g1~~TRINITY_DN30246_c0_g1_i1.p2  ORF type:complete len:363 (+),score=79.76 TRINITY_DN30246_c0_g1_i1:85-1089(+)
MAPQGNAAGAPVAVLGMNPALQKTMRFAELRVGDVNRAASVQWGVGGKGQNVARALTALGAEGAALVHPLGGEAGRRVSAQLEEAGVKQAVVPVAGETRTCTTLVCEAGGHATELIDPSARISPEESRSVAAEVARAAARCASGGVIMLCGTCPPGLETIYEDTARGLATGPGAPRLFLDGYKGVDGLLATRRVDVLKVNASELRQLCGAAADAPLPEVCAAAHSRHGVGTIAITDGPRPGLISCSGTGCDGLWWCNPPVLPDGVPVRNPIGAGDAGAAALCFALLLRGDHPARAMAFAQSVATASCATDHCAVWDPALSQSLVDALSAAPAGQ